MHLYIIPTVQAIEFPWNVLRMDSLWGIQWHFFYFQERLGNFYKIRHMCRHVR